MKHFVLYLFLNSILLLNGCAVPANFPPFPIKTNTNELPDKWRFDNSSCPVVMEENDYKGFFVKWNDPINGPNVKLIEMAAAQGSRKGLEELKIIDELRELGLVIIRIGIFFTPQGNIILKGKERLNITFTDGSTALDKGAFVFKHGKKFDSRKQTVHLNRDWGGYNQSGEAIFLLILVPREHLGKTVGSITLQ